MTIIGGRYWTSLIYSAVLILWASNNNKAKNLTRPHYIIIITSFIVLTCRTVHMVWSNLSKNSITYACIYVYLSLFILEFTWSCAIGTAQLTFGSHHQFLTSRSCMCLKNKHHTIYIICNSCNNQSISTKMHPSI